MTMKRTSTLEKAELKERENEGKTKNDDALISCTVRKGVERKVEGKIQTDIEVNSYTARNGVVCWLLQFQSQFQLKMTS